MNRVSSRNTRAVVLRAALFALLCVSPAIAQTSDSTATSTNTSAPASNSELLKGTEFQDKPYSSNNYAGMGESVPLRKDAWSWYWNEKAQVPIDSQNKGGFWGNDAVSDLFRNVANNVVIPFWNGAMEYDFIRAGLLLVVAGMLLGFGATLVIPKKPETK
jgi:hypothetical protein